MFLRTILTLSVASASLWAQESGRLSGPVSGFAFDDQAHALRVIVGIPGAAYLGRSVATSLDFASVSPDGRLAITLQGEQLSLMHLDTSETVALGGWSGGVDKAAWNDASDAVALAGANLGLFRNLKTAPEPVTLASFAGKATALAVDAQGRLVLATTDQGVFVVNGSDARLAAAIEGATGLALGSNGTLYVASKAGKQVDTVRNWTDSAEIATLAGGIEDPSALAVSRDGSTLFVADAASKSLILINAATGEVLSRLELDFTPARADRLANGLFQLNARTGAQDALQLLDSAQRIVFFVPTQDLSALAAVSVEE